MSLPGLYQYKSAALEDHAQLSGATTDKTAILFQIYATLDSTGPASGYLLIYDLSTPDAAPANGTIPDFPPIAIVKGTPSFASAASNDVPVAMFLKGVRVYFQTGVTYQSAGSAGNYVQFISLVQQ
jgi:hypothetical protein